ncbi:retrovirus-related pol polyprotein from transposon TNT 1-94 [Tanacetum coccineum]
MLLAKKNDDEQVHLAEDQAWMKSSSDSDQEISTNMVFMAKMEKILLGSKESSSCAEETIAEVSYYSFDFESDYEYETLDYYDNSTNYGLFVDNDDDQETFHDAINLLVKMLMKIILLHASYDLNDLYVFDDASIRNSRVSKMPFRKKPRNSLNVRSKNNSNNFLPRTLFRWLPKMQPLAEPVAKWIPKIFQICLLILNSGCSKHMTGNRALLTNFVERFLGTVRFGNDDFVVIFGYGDVVIGSMTIKKVYYVDDEASEVIISFIKKTQVNIQLQVQRVRMDNGTAFKNKTLAKFLMRCYLLNDYDDVGKLKEKRDIGVFVGYLKESAAFKIYNKHLEDLFHDFYDEYFDTSKITKSPTTNVETSNEEIPPSAEEVFHEISKSFQEDSISSSLNDDVQQSSEEVEIPSSNTQSVLNNMDPNVNKASQIANSCLFTSLLSSIEPTNIAEALKDADWVSAMQEELNQFARFKVWRLVPRPKGKTIINSKWIFKNKKDESSLLI